MKKIASLLIIICLGFSVVAQNAEPADSKVPLTKKGYKILPEKGDFALGIDAVPFFEYIGNMFNKEYNNTPFADGFNGSIAGKYFIFDDMALRLRVNADFSGKEYKGVVANDTEIYNNPMNTDATVIDYRTVNVQEFGLAAGWEYRRGYRRIQGVFGGELGGGIKNKNITYEYGNPISELNQHPSTTDFDDNITATGRVLEKKAGLEWNVFIAGFVGVEYFIAPKLSLGAEFALGFIAKNRSQGKLTTEQWDGNQVFEQTIRDYDKDNPSKVFAGGTLTRGSIFLMFHF